MLRQNFHKLRLKMSLGLSKFRYNCSCWWRSRGRPLLAARRGLITFFLIGIAGLSFLQLSRMSPNLPPFDQSGGDIMGDLLEEGNPFADILGEPPADSADSVESGPEAAAPTADPEGEPEAQMVTISPEAQAKVTAKNPPQLSSPAPQAQIQEGYALSAKSTTLNDWRPHLAVDFAAAKQMEVLAAAAGTISQIKANDPYWGTMVTIEHGDGWATQYSNIAALKVAKGDWVEAQEAIGCINNNPPLELLDPLHLHFELLYEGEPQDPGDAWNHND